MRLKDATGKGGSLQVGRARGTLLESVRRRRSKYHAIPTMVDGIRFDSKREAARYRELQILVKAGQITNLQLQPKFPLYVSALGDRVGDGSHPVQVGTYIGDFAYTQQPADRDVIEDVKGVKTPIYRLKKRIVEALYGIEIREVK